MQIRPFIHDWKNFLASALVNPDQVLARRANGGVILLVIIGYHSLSTRAGEAMYGSSASLCSSRKTTLISLSSYPILSSSRAICYGKSCTGR